jgi:hypothetical protein
MHHQLSAYAKTVFPMVRLDEQTFLLVAFIALLT